MSYMGMSSLAQGALFHSFIIGKCGPVVGPGSLTPYGGPRQQSLFGGFGIVQDPAKGFFIAGSSLEDINGVYGRTQHVSAALHRHSFMLAYKNEESGMLLALVESKLSEGSQWLLIDANLQDRFGCAGGGILPGSGPKWRRFENNGGDARASDSNHKVALQEDVEQGAWDELPWQVIGIMGDDMLKNLRSHILFRKESVKRAKQGVGLPPPSAGSLEAAWREGAWFYRVVDSQGAGVYVLPRTNSTRLSTMHTGDYIRVTLQRGNWLRLADRSRWGKRPCWSSASRFVRVPDVEIAAVDQVPTHDGSVVFLLDRQLTSPESLVLPSSAVKHIANASHIPSESDSRSPEDLVRSGWLGVEAAQALQMAENVESFNLAEKGVAALKILSAKATDKGPLDRMLLLRLVLIPALLRCLRTREAVGEAEAAVRAHPSSCIALLLLARCRFRLGLRRDAEQSLEAAASMSHADSFENKWGKIPALLQLRALRIRDRFQSEAEIAYAGASDAAAAATNYGRALAAMTDLPDDQWGRALLLADRAVCLRRMRMYDEALHHLNQALELFPRYKRGLFRKGMLLLEIGNPSEAITAFEGLLRHDRDWPNLVDWLTRAHTLLRRAKRARGAPPGSAEDDLAENYYDLLSVPVDFTLEELKQAFRKASLKYHPDKPGGSQRAFQRVAAAYETLSNTERCQEYNKGMNLGNIFEEVERKYFPERYHFLPFGDPFENKRMLEVMTHRSNTRQNWRERSWDL